MLNEYSIIEIVPLDYSKSLILRAVIDGHFKRGSQGLDDLDKKCQH